MPNYERAIARLKNTLVRQLEAAKITQETIAALEAALLHNHPVLAQARVLDAQNADAEIHLRKK